MREIIKPTETKWTRDDHARFARFFQECAAKEYERSVHCRFGRTPAQWFQKQSEAYYYAARYHTYMALGLDVSSEFV